MNERQAKRVTEAAQRSEVDGASVALWAIPAGSYLLVRNVAPGRTQLIEVLDPETSRLLCWDFGPEGTP